MELEVKHIHNNYLNGRNLFIAKITILGLKENIKEILVRDADEEWVTLKSMNYSYKQNIQQLNIQNLNIYFL